MTRQASAVHRIWLLLLTSLVLIEQSTAYFRMQKVNCESYNKSWVVINHCRLRAINRTVTVFNMNLTILKPAYDIGLSISTFKKANGFRPFPIRTTINCCEFIKKRNNPIANMIYALFKDFSNINHTCPYAGDQLLNGFYLRHDLFKLPLPDGEYALHLDWFLHKVKTFTTSVWFDFTE